MKKFFIAFLAVICYTGCAGCGKSDQTPVKRPIVPALDESAFFETPTPIPPMVS